MYFTGTALKVYWSVLDMCCIMAVVYSIRCVLYCTVLYCTVLHCTVLYCTVLYCTVLYCTVLYCIVLYCTVLYCTVLYCIVLYCTVLYCTVLAIYKSHYALVFTCVCYYSSNPFYTTPHSSAVQIILIWLLSEYCPNYTNTYLNIVWGRTGLPKETIIL